MKFMSIKDYTVLSVHAGHNATAAIMRNGEILVAAMEERFSKKKNYVGYPKQAIDYCLKKSGILASNLNRVAFTTKSTSGLLNKAKITTQFSIQDFHDYYGEKYYARRLRGESVATYLDWLDTEPKFNEVDPYFNFSWLTRDVYNNTELDSKLFREEQARTLAEHLGIESEQVEFLDHHACHAHYAYFGSPFRDADCLIITLDGWGDGRNQTVWLAQSNNMNLLAESNANDLGRIFKLATLLLGMRPDEHEFKVMGLAPYAKGQYVEQAMRVIQDLCEVDGMRIVSKNRPQDLYSYLKEAWKCHRFDNIAGAVQRYTEEIACRLVRNVISETGVKRLVISGGITMNVKMNKAILEIPEVEEFYVCGSGADESLSLGGCYLMNSENGNNLPINSLYLGSDIADELDAYDFSYLESEFTVTKSVKNADIAKLLFAGEIVAVIRGRAEFGARALGNRSILADPSKREAVQRINEAIKNRDFWMPFALSVMSEYADKYVVNPKRISSPFMALSLDTKPEAYSDIQAGTHPYDKTVRPQFVDKKVSPGYHALLAAFAELSGIPALLNTSLNLHGEPVVNSIADAVRTFKLSGLDHLLIEDCILISKRPN